MDKRAVVRWREAESSCRVARVAPTHPRCGVSESRERLLALRPPRPPRVPLGNSAYRIHISNRKLPLLESSVSNWKQTIASLCNRKKIGEPQDAVCKRCHGVGTTRLSPGLSLHKPRVTSHESRVTICPSRITNHAVLLDTPCRAIFRVTH